MQYSTGVITPAIRAKSNSKPNSQGIVVHFGKQLVNRFGMIRVVIVTKRVVAIHFKPLGSSEGQIDQVGVCQCDEKSPLWAASAAVRE